MKTTILAVAALFVATPALAQRSYQQGVNDGYSWGQMEQRQQLEHEQRMKELSRPSSIERLMHPYDDLLNNKPWDTREQPDD